MNKSKIYTRTGDKGETSLVSGTRKYKSDFQIDLYGEVDELNSHIGFLSSLLTRSDFNSTVETLSHIQHKLFDLGSLLACESEKWDEYKLPQIKSSSLELLEKDIDLMDSDLPKLKNFILPGGTQAGAYSHIARTVCRRVERKLIAFSRDGNALPENAIEFLNRLSDYFFVLGRMVNNSADQEETIWVKNY